MEHPEIIVPTKKAKIYMQIEALKWAISQDNDDFSRETHKLALNMLELKQGYRNPTGFRRWVKVSKKTAACVIIRSWEHGNRKTDTSIYYSIILFLYANIERNC